MMRKRILNSKFIRTTLFVLVHIMIIPVVIFDFIKLIKCCGKRKPEALSYLVDIAFFGYVGYGAVKLLSQISNEGVATYLILSVVVGVLLAKADKNDNCAPPTKALAQVFGV